MTILAEIMSHKRAEVAARKEQVPTAALLEIIEARRRPLDFAGALQRGRCVSLIAEVKRGSPSRGVLVDDYQPLQLARLYAAHGAAGISILTDEKYFGGSLNDLQQIAALDLGLPLLRKDFVCDPYQIYEARAAGADAILLIVTVLSDHQLCVFQSLARRLGLAALVEVHTRWELARALRCGASLIGINNRDLRDYSVSLETTRKLRPLVPESVVVVAESGISRPEDIEGLAVDAILVGEAILRSADVAAKVIELAGVRRYAPASGRWS